MTNRLGMNDVPYDASRLNTLTLSSAVASADVDAITALTGDITATGPGSVAATLATVNANVGTFGSATQVAQVTANAKGLITAISNVTITGASPVGAALTRGSIWRGSAANLAEAYALGAANKVLQSDGTDAIWSNFTLTISGNSTINGSLIGNITGGGTLATGAFTLTVPATGTAALGAGTLTVSTTNDVTGASHTHAITSSSNPGAAARILASDASGFLSLTRIGLGSNTAIDGATIYNGRTITDPNFSAALFYWYANNTALTVNPSSNTVGGWRAYGASYSVSATGANNIGTLFGGVFFVANNSTGTLTTHTAGVFDISANSASTVTSTTGTAASITMTKSGAGTWNLTNAYFINCVTQVTAGTFAPQNLYGLKVSDITHGTVTNHAIYTGLGLVRHGDQVSVVGGADRTQLTVTGFSTQTNTLAQLTRNDGNTSAVVTMLTATVNTTGTAAAGFGGAIALNLESSTMADQAAAAIDWLWTDATHASRTALYRGKTTGNATNTGYYGHWNHSAVAGSAITVIPNATGDVTEIATFVYAVAEVTGTGTSGGTVTVTPGGGAVTLYSDGTDTLQLTCAADGSVTVQRSAGTDTFKVSLWGTWL